MADPGAHFAAFSFVDRIDVFEPRRLVRGRYRVPPDVRFPACLAAEAVGQLAAWVSMDAVGYRGRPVAALAGDTRFHGDVPSGAVLELAADVESCDDEAGRPTPAGRRSTAASRPGLRRPARASRRAPAAPSSTCRRRRRSSPITFRAARCSRRRCCSTRRSRWRKNSPPSCPTGRRAHRRACCG
jgi:hypothetical protein